jgi:hypothetical protein
MKTIIPTLESGVTAKGASDWLRQIVRSIGPCFHFDTRPEDYIHSGGTPLLSMAECKRLNQGIDQAFEVLGRDAFEDECLRTVWEQLGVRYDVQLDQLVPIAS